MICYNMRNGQAMLEYVLVLAGLLAVCSILGGLVTTAVRSGARAESLVTSDYP